MKLIDCVVCNQDLLDRNWLPNYATAMAAAIDLRAMFESKESKIIYPDQIIPIHTGLMIHINDPGLVGIAVPKSGLGSKKGIVLSNTVGIIDADYQGEIILSCWNRSESKYEIEYGEKVMQMLFVRIEQVQFRVCEEFSSITDRAHGRFGSTGRM